MSSRLSKLFEALTITTATSVRRKRLVKRQRRPFKLVRPPKMLHINMCIGRPYIQFYGYEATPEFLVRLAEEKCPEALRDRNDRDYEIDAMTQAHMLILARSGILPLFYMTCFKPQDGSVPPVWLDAFGMRGFNRDHIDEDELIANPIVDVQVLAVCSDIDRSFERRPTQAQMDAITELMGYAPQWWVGYGIGDYH
ncbi:hypothetical protein DEU56DRAFT_180378 [Suillus clintonianus]|uniref:uncharacterized protein n=1 Tax=Suillus clintonianus TaxID=1904413 RepID=UPI001B870C0A|nr:uncharacterized protein DEU56DRAFT_180378 [Suillus clintonianus]KAG2114850.1 hypothetical protein DEU56DRAFT_180378 [Suillus clintonianus]